ncbi:beta-class carbonic anhydrase [Amedibacillus sp. YH-ame6]
MVHEILKYNKEFVKEKKYEPFQTSKFPGKKLAIVTCMDTRLIELLPAALGIRNGDAKIIKNAGGVISHPFGSAVRSLLIAIYDLGVEDIMIIGHTDCGVQHMDSIEMLQKMRSRGVSSQVVDTMQYCGIDFDEWLGGFADVEESVLRSIQLLHEHPLIPSDVRIYGFVMDSLTGELREV